ncbi:MAG: hypothetical protein RR653_08185, partial [Clostridia bacterium]
LLFGQLVVSERKKTESTRPDPFCALLKVYHCTERLSTDGKKPHLEIYFQTGYTTLGKNTIPNNLKGALNHEASRV